MLGGYFSNRFFQAQIAKDLYVKKVEDKPAESKNKKRNSASKKSFKEKPINNESSDQDKDQETKKKKKQVDQSIQQIHDQFETIKFSSFYLVFDPFLEIICCPVNICFSDMFCFKRSRILQKASDKFNEEMQVSNILNKIRNTHQMLKNFQIIDQEKFVKYNEDYVISPHDSCSDDHGLGISDKEIGIGNEAENIGLDMQFAFGMSVLKDIKVSKQSKKDMMGISSVYKTTKKIKNSMNEGLKRKFTNLNGLKGKLEGLVETSGQHEFTSKDSSESVGFNSSDLGEKHP